MALPLDLFRIAAGLICVAYFTHQWAIARDFAAPDGVLDHELQARIYWFTRLSLFQPGASFLFIQAALAAAWLASWGVLAGWRVRPCAALALVVAVSLFRWNLLVMEVDDFIIHLLLVWMILLPVGRTLTWESRLREGSGAWDRWRRVEVPAAALYCVLANACLVYLIAGPTKLTSGYWRSGFALYATLRLDISHTRDFWGPRHVPLLMIGNYAALAIEIALPFLLLRPKGSRLKWLGLLGQAGLHAGIVSAFGLPFVNLTMLSTSILFFREEIMDALGAAPAAGSEKRIPAAGRAGAVLVAVLALAVTRDIPLLGALKGPAYVALWAGGLFQDYRLFDWIDTKNVRVDYEAVSTEPGRPPRPFDGRLVFPATMQHLFLQAYLHDVRWVYVPCRHRPALKESIMIRAARQYCRARPEATENVSVSAVVGRITPENAARSTSASGASSWSSTAPRGSLRFGARSITRCLRRTARPAEASLVSKECSDRLRGGSLRSESYKCFEAFCAAWMPLSAA